MGMTAMGRGALFVAALAGPAAAQDRPRPLERMDACRAETDPAKRLACYDQAAADLAEAERRQDVVVIDRAEEERRRRDAFGLNERRREAKAERAGAPEVDEIAGTVASARRLPYGEWVITLAGGGTWRQIGSDEVGREPKPGVKVTVRKGLVGNYLMKLDGGRLISVRRAG